MAESQEYAMLNDHFYDDPSQLSQLLRQRAGTRFPVHSIDSTVLRSVNATPTLITDGQPSPQAAGPALSLSLSPTRTAPRRVRIDPRHVTPKLHKHHTAPTGLLTEKEDARKLYQTFNGVMDAPGDTQIDPEVFKLYTSGLLDSNSVLGAIPRPERPVSAAEEASQESARDSMAVSSQSQRRGSITSPMTINDDAETRSNANYAPTSPLKLLATPAGHTGRENGGQGEALSSVARTIPTPGTDLSASAFFGLENAADVNAMSLTQAFNATQAKTSPAVGIANEDVVFQRPSPNFTTARRSSPGTNMSSPIKVHNRRDTDMDVVMRSSSEPRADYESMKQSQERRNRERAIADIGPVERQDSWDEPTSVEKSFFRQKAKQRLNQKAAKFLAGVSAPTPSDRPSRKRGSVSMRATTTSPHMTTRTRNHHGPYDGAGADAPYELSHCMPRPGDNSEDSLDELSQDIVPLPKRRAASGTAVKETRAEQRIQVPHTSSHPLHNLSGHSSLNLSQPNASLSQPQPGSQFRASASQPLPKSLSRLRSSKETEVVMDSQPDPVVTPGASQPATLRYPSSPSTNQYSINQTTMLSKLGTVSSPISSSMPPMPPRTSSPELAMAVEEGPKAEGIPSSPPLVAKEDDITYDEHAYEEFSGDERDETEVQATEDDLDIDAANDDDHDLPSLQDDAESGSEGGAEDLEYEQNSRKDDEVPETIEQEQGETTRIYSTLPEDEPDEISNPTMGRPRMTQQPTIPETDVLEETQPSFFPDAGNAEQPDNSGEAAAGDHVDEDQANGSGRLGSRNDPQLEDQVTVEVPGGTEEGPAPHSPTITKGRSLRDIADLPDTQRSVDLNEIDLPQLGLSQGSDDPLDTMMARDALRPHKKRRTTYGAKKLFRSPIKDTDGVSDQLTSSPQMGVSHGLGWSPPTTQDREAHGAQAATRTREEAAITNPATLKSKMLLKPTQPQTPRMGALKSVNKALLSKSPGKTPPSSTPRGRGAERTTPTPSTAMSNADVDMHDADDVPMPNVSFTEYEQAVAYTSDDGELPSGERTVPNRVFAFWPGTAYYPATCVGRVDNHRLRVRYDDGTLNTLESAQVRALDLRPGDQVKIDVVGMKKQAYIVTGFKDKINVEDETVEYPLTNRHGYATVVLEEKQRESLPPKAHAPTKKHVAVSVSNVYLTSMLWTRIKDRQFQYTPGASPAVSTPQGATPKSGASPVPVPTVLRRSTAGTSLLREPTARASSVASSVRSSGNVFLNMAFAVTSTNDSVNKRSLGKLITSNGGLMVEDGFHELFGTESYDAPMSSAGSGKSSGLDGLQLKAKYEDLGFVALIAQSHSRSPKYIQALSLNIPCLHVRWIHDSLAAGRALPFAKYLLPAGTSTYLDPAGVVRSRDMSTFDPSSEDVSFAQMVRERKLLFRDQSVLILSEENGQEPYVFLTHAMGAANVGQCNDPDEAKESVESGAWDWVYVDGKADSVADSAAQILGTNGGKSAKKKAAKKRKRDESAKAEALVRSAVVRGKKVNVACGEFVIQSLILGALVEE